MKINILKRREFSFIKSINFIFQIALIVLIFSCENENEPLVTNICDYKNLTGEYLFYSKTDTSSQKIEIDYLGSNRFQTKGIGGYGFWLPSAPLSGKINDCQIILDSYENIKRKGLPSPGGYPRTYYESMSGYGEYFNKSDSIKLFITYKRTGDFTEYFSGEIYLIKVQ